MTEWLARSLGRRVPGWLLVLALATVGAWQLYPCVVP